MVCSAAQKFKNRTLFGITQKISIMKDKSLNNEKQRIQFEFYTRIT